MRLKRRRLTQVPYFGGVSSFTQTPQPFHSHSFLNDREVLPFVNIVSWPGSFYDSGQNVTYVGMAAVTRRENSVARIQAYDHATNTWGTVYDVGAWKAIDDAHGQPALCKDGEDYIYCFYAGHGTVSDALWAISKSPNDITAWNQQGALGTDLTYPKPVLVGSDIHLYMRKTNTVSTSWLYTHRSGTPSGGALTFSAEAELIDFGADSRAYAGEVHLRDGTDVHIIMTRANETDTERKGVYYFIHETDTGAVRNYAGTVTIAVGDLPVDLTEANASFRIFDHGSNRGHIPSLQFDSADNPHVLFLDGTGTTFALKHMYGTGSAFTSPETLATMTDPNASTGDINVNILVPGAGTTMQAWYIQNEDTVRGGDMVRRVLDEAGGTWAAAGTILAAGSNALNAQVPVKDAHPSMRVVFSEVLQSNDYTNADNLDRYTYGDAGFSLGPDPVMFQHLEQGDEAMICGVDPNTGLIHDLSWNGLDIITRQGDVGVSGGYMTFDGTGDYVQFNDSALWPLTGDFTIEVRLLTFNVVNTIQIFASHWTSSGNQRGWYFGYDGVGGPQLQFILSTNGSGTTVINDTAGWTPSAMVEYDSVAVQRSGTDLTFWVDGVQIGDAQTLSGNSFNSTAALFIGALTTTVPASFLNGQATQVRIIPAAVFS